MTWIGGLLVAAIALVALRIRPMRWLNAAIGAWVVIAGILLPHIAVGTMLNNILVGLLVLLAGGGQDIQGPFRRARCPDVCRRLRRGAAPEDPRAAIAVGGREDWLHGGDAAQVAT